MTENDNTTLDIIKAIDALLLISPEPVTPAHIASVIGVDMQEVEKCVETMTEKYRNRGVRIQNYGGRIALTTAPELSGFIERFLGLETSSRLSRAGLETLAIIAYQQPVTRPYIESIRGVGCDGVMKSLIGKGLVREAGRTEGPGRPILYETSPEFLQYFGLGSIGDLPKVITEPKINDLAHDGIFKE